MSSFFFRKKIAESEEKSGQTENCLPYYSHIHSTLQDSTMTQFKHDYEGKVKAQMAEHWGMAPEVYDQFRKGVQVDHNDGWSETEFLDSDGNVSWFMEVNAQDEVWNFDWV